jgi:hypothetical protein
MWLHNHPLAQVAILVVLGIAFCMGLVFAAMGAVPGGRCE